MLALANMFLFAALMAIMLAGFYDAESHPIEIKTCEKEKKNEQENWWNNSNNCGRFLMRLPRTRYVRIRNHYCHGKYALNIGFPLHIKF
jgi:hypothetical protein